MIRYELLCANDHRFESWFRDSAAYDKMADAGAVECPTCGDRSVRKALMAPRLARRKGQDGPARPPREERAAQVSSAADVPVPQQAAQFPAGNSEKVAEFHRRMSDVLRQVQDAVEKHCDYVGDNFAEEARKIHYGETEARGIYGETTPEEAEELKDEGVSFASIPWRRPVS
ncbi:DUF1178 family protein [Caenispirillum salinarum]|uniref:DUF1178 family protein n=1 Tax=Caenispirillum salinarum TaxID=859058 RepID=UPI003850ABA7